MFIDGSSTLHSKYSSLDKSYGLLLKKKKSPDSWNKWRIQVKIEYIL